MPTYRLSTPQDESPVSVVWLKRDLRLGDHAPLKSAVERGAPLLIIYCFEPSLLKQPDSSTLHVRFQEDSLKSLNALLEPHGAQIYVFYREVIDVLRALKEHLPRLSLLSHQETGNQHTYARDISVARWCKAEGVRWVEYPTQGVIRGLRARSGWSDAWLRHMEADLAEPDLARGVWAQLSSSWFNERRGVAPFTWSTDDLGALSKAHQDVGEAQDETQDEVEYEIQRAGTHIARERADCSTALIFISISAISQSLSRAGASVHA